MKSFFKNNETGSIKAGWRILIFLGIFMIISVALQFILKTIIGGLPPKGFYRNAAIIIIAAIASTSALYITAKKINNVSFSHFGLKWSKQAYHDMIIGFLLSAFMAASFFGILIMTNLISFEGINWDSSYQFDVLKMSIITLILLLFVDLLVGWWEELVFRGYLLQTMMDGMGVKIAILISCLLYGVVHMANPNATMYSFIIIILFGFMRLYGYLKTKQLWLSMGMHMGWNFFQGPIFGFAASGNESAVLISHSNNGPDYLTGGSFGPEASIIIIPIIGIALIAMNVWSKKRTV